METMKNDRDTRVVIYIYMAIGDFTKHKWRLDQQMGI